MDTAKECILEVFPDATIIPNRTDNYPVKVIITAKIGSNNVKIWSGKQQDLFSKYRAKRTRSVNEIKGNLIELRDE